jgi:uncharacterized protein YdeI (YjbR/CyaY-like superfamily)
MIRPGSEYHSFRLYNYLMRKIPVNCMSFAKPAEWRDWLERYHATEQEAWLFISREAAARKYILLGEAVEEALCFGWIHGALQPISHETYALRFSPRQSNSIWSIHNQHKVEKLIQQGRMTPAGMEKVAQAKATGQWEAAILREDVSSVPDDLVQALEENDAWLEFEQWPASQKRMYLYWLESAKRLETRDKRIHAIVEKAKRGKFGFRK